MSICPSSNLDPWADDQLVDPYEGYKELRALGPVVYLERHDVYAVVSHEAARQVLQNWEIFSSASGVGLSPTMNERGAGGVLTSDPPQHTPLRGVLNRQLIPPEVKRHRDALADRADRLVDAIVSEPFDAVEDLAVPYSVGVVGDKLAAAVAFVVHQGYEQAPASEASEAARQAVWAPVLPHLESRAGEPHGWAARY